MKKKMLVVCALCLIATGFAAGRNFDSVTDEGYVLERDADVARSGPAPHNGPGRSTGYSFFEKVPGFHYAFRKRVLHPGAAIGYHLQREDEIYYILSGSGIMQMNGKEFPVGPGDAVLTRPGSSHGLKQTGDSDLVLMISYEVNRK